MENMTKYELMKDLPTFKKGEIFVLMGAGLHRYSDGLMAYPRAVIDKYPDILNEWFREVENKPEVWEPEWGDEYYSIDVHGYIEKCGWGNNCLDTRAMGIGNVFRTRIDADKALAWLKARKVLYDDAKGFEPNWKDEQERKWFVAWEESFNNGLITDCYYSMANSPGPYFATKEDARASIKAHEKEWKIYLLGGEE